MELIVISESKLKIMLSGADMAKYRLAEEGMDCADRHTREAFRHIFEDAREEIGFETEGARLFIQFYASKEGGGELFVTKLSEGNLSWDTLGELPFSEIEAAAPLAVEAALSEGERSLLRRVYACEEAVFRRVRVRVESLTELLALCRRLWGRGFEGESSAYIVEDGGREVWYLCLEVAWAAGTRLPRELAFVAEYGRLVEGKETEMYLAEHGRVIREGDAVEVLGRM